MQKALAPGAGPQNPMGELTALPHTGTPSWVGESPLPHHPVITCPHPAPKPLHFIFPSYTTVTNLYVTIRHFGK